LGWRLRKKAAGNVGRDARDQRAVRAQPISSKPTRRTLRRAADELADAGAGGSAGAGNGRKGGDGLVILVWWRNSNRVMPIFLVPEASISAMTGTISCEVRSSAARGVVARTRPGK